MKKFIIYLRRNLINGKCYVGQTCDFKGREANWKCLKARYANPNINEDRLKFGLDNFTVEVLAEADNQEDAWELEQRFIRDYNTIYPNGYNLAKGGCGNNGCKLSNETRQKMSEAKKGKKNYWYGKHLYDETRQKMSEAKKGEKHPFYGKLNREDKSKQVYQYTLDGELVKIWPSTNECGRNGFNIGNVAACCRGERKTHKGHKWSYTPL